MKIQDTPVTEISQDLLDRSGLVGRLCSLLTQSSSDEPGLVIGLDGPWGSGKSTILNWVHESLSAKGDAIVVRFNPWVFEDSSNLLREFFDEMRIQFKNSKSDSLRKLSKNIEKYQGAIGALSEFLPFPLNFVKVVNYKPKEHSFNEERTNLVEKLRSVDKRIVVLIDEFDRIENENIRDMAQLIKAVGDLPNISYLIGYDRQRVEQALMPHSGDGQDYLKKIIQINVPMRPLMDYEIEDLIGRGLKDLGFEEKLGDSDLYDEAIGPIRHSIDTPRDIKRLLSLFSSLEPLVREEINSIDVLAYCALSNRAPDLREKFVLKIDKLVTDRAIDENDFEEMLSDAPSTFSEIFDTKIARRDALLLTYLFPHKNNGSPDTSRYGRIHFRRNFLKMLYLGSPPILVPRKDVVDFWTSPSRDRLADFEKRGLTDEFLQSLEDSFASLPREGDVDALAILASTDEMPPHSEQGARIREIEAVKWLLIRTGRDNPLAERFSTILRGLCNIPAAALLADFVRHHMFAFGLASGFPARGGDTVLTKEETLSLLENLRPIWESIILDGTWLSSKVFNDVMFALEQSGNWNDTLKQAAESQLRESSAIYDLAAITLPPRSRMTHGTLESFVSEELVREIMAETAPPEDPYLLGCFDRLGLYLAQSRDVTAAGSDD